MEIIIPGTNLFEEKLNEKIQLAVNEEIQKLDKSIKYSFCLEFDETLIYSNERIEAFIIPDEKLPQYQRGKGLHGKDKMYATLSYQLKVAEEMIESYGISINHASIQGSPFVETDCINISLQEQEEKELKLDKKRKNDRTIKCNVIMPSITGFAKNLYNVCEKLEKEKDCVLERAFGNKELYEKTISEVMKPLVKPAITIFELQVYKKTKTDTGMHKYVGQVSLMTNGKIIKVEYCAKRGNYDIPNENFDDCYIEVTEKYDNHKLINNIRELIEKANMVCEKNNFSIDKDTMYNILDFIDIKRLIKKAREA
jgi:hypothetical protein